MDEKEFLPRIGTFFIVMGLGLVLLFVISDLANAVTYKYFFGGLLLIVIGIAFRRNAAKPEASGRFSAWKKMNSKEKIDKE